MLEFGIAGKLEALGSSLIPKLFGWHLAPIAGDAAVAVLGRRADRDRGDGRELFTGTARRAERPGGDAARRVIGRVFIRFAAPALDRRALPISPERSSPPPPPSSTGLPQQGMKVDPSH